LQHNDPQCGYQYIDRMPRANSANMPDNIKDTMKLISCIMS